MWCEDVLCDLGGCGEAMLCDLSMCDVLCDPGGCGVRMFCVTLVGVV